MRAHAKFKAYQTINAERQLQEFVERYPTRRVERIWDWRYLSAEPVTWAYLATSFAAHKCAAGSATYSVAFSVVVKTKSENSCVHAAVRAILCCCASWGCRSAGASQAECAASDYADVFVAVGRARARGCAVGELGRHAAVRPGLRAADVAG